MPGHQHHRAGRRNRRCKIQPLPPPITNRWRDGSPHHPTGELPALTSRGIATILGDLATMGYDAEWGVLGAVNMGAEHERYRIWIVAYSDRAQLERRCVSVRIPEEHPHISNPRWRQDKPGVDRASNGLAFEMDRLRAIGNGQVPAVAARAFTECLRRIM